MSSLWPWFVVAGVGALHGLNPATGWMLAAAWGMRSRDRTQALRALVPIAIGHTASVALVAGAVVWGVAMDRVVLQVLTGGLFAVTVIAHLSGRMPQVARVPAGHAGLALWSFMMSTVHGAGLMLVPALVPLCAGDASVLEITGSGPLTLAFAAAGLHMAAMLAVTGVVATGVCRGFHAGARLLRRPNTSKPRACFIGQSRPSQDCGGGVMITSHYVATWHEPSLHPPRCAKLNFGCEQKTDLDDAVLP